MTVYQYDALSIYMEVLGKLKNSGYSALTLWRYKNGLERHENGYQLWLNSYEAFISLYFFSMCTNTHLTEDIMLKYRRISRNLIQKNLFS